MNDMLLALPINGESFLLRRSGKHLLVDGGLKGDKIARVLELHVKDVKRLDVVVCTHGDSDHVGGLPGLLNDWGHRVGQLWLPGRWVNVLPKLTQDPQKFLKQLTKELDAELEDPSPQVLSIVDHTEGQEIQHYEQREAIPHSQIKDHESTNEGPSDFGLPSPALNDLPPEPSWFQELRHAKKKWALDKTNDKADLAFNAARQRVRRRQKLKASDLQNRIALYWLGLIETAQAIHDLAVAAIRHEIPTRWFDFDGFQQIRNAAGGIRGFLVPINAVEQAPPPTIRAHFMHLTMINQESLVFLAPPARERLGVVFCADSPLGDGQSFNNSFFATVPSPMPWLSLVATAPHHGSESNKVAYKHLQNWANISVFLRSGGSAKQPGHTYLNQKNCLRLCAKCPKVGHAPMLSGVVAAGPYWCRLSLIALGRRCDCYT